MHKKIKKLLEHVISHDIDEEKREKVLETVAFSVRDLTHPQQFYLYMQLDLAINGPLFTKEQAQHAVACLENEDGSTGEYWTIEETTSALNSKGIKIENEHFNENDFYYMMNFIHSTIPDLGSPDMYIKNALAWLRSKNSPHGIAKKIYYSLKY